MTIELWTVLAMAIGIAIGAPIGPWLAEKEAEWKMRRLVRRQNKDPRP